MGRQFLQLIIMNDITDKNFLEKLQTQTMENGLLHALEYHYSNYARYEKVIVKEHPFDKSDSTLKRQLKMNVFSESLRPVKLELMAYLLWIKRFRCFLINRNVLEPKDIMLKGVWHSIMDRGSVVAYGDILYLINKWVAHRSIDDPRDEVTITHLEMLFNLEGTSIMSKENGYIFVSLSGHTLTLSEQHQHIIELVKWVFRLLPK